MTPENIPQKNRSLLTSQAILRFLITEDDKLDTLILCQNTEIDLVTTDFNVYEALGSIRDYDKFKLKKLVKLFEVVDIQNTNTKKTVLTHERVEELRNLALHQGGAQDE